MQNYIYIREGDLLAWVVVMRLANGQWEAFVFFELGAAHGDEAASVIKWRLADRFDDDEDAEIAASTFALHTMRHHAREIASLHYLGGSVHAEHLACRAA